MMNWHRAPGGLLLDKNDVKLSEVSPELYRRLWREFIRPHVGRLGIALALMLLSALTSLAGPYLVGLAIDRFIVQQDKAGLNLVALAFLFTALVHWWTAYGQTYIMSAVGQTIIYAIRDRMFRHLQRLGFRFYDSMHAGRIMSRLMGDVDALNQLVSQGLVSLFADSILLLFILGAMLRMNATLTLVTVGITVPLILLVIAYFKNRMRRAFMAQRRKAAELNANLGESISGVRVAQSFNREEQNAAEFGKINEENRQANMQTVSVMASFFPAIEVIAALSTTIVLWFGGWQLRVGAEAVTIGTVAAFILYLGRFFQPIRDLSQIYNVFQAAVVSAERVFEVLDQEPEIVDAPGARPMPPVHGEVAFRDVSFAYNEGQPVLKGISLRAAPGETVALVGPTGAGKTSVINLLARFYDPQAGAVLVDGIDLRTVTQESWRQQIGIVLQDTFLFTGTIRENIRFSRPGATDAAVEAAAEAVGAHDFVARMPEGYDTEVNERGSKLSVGQRQLIAFARALCADPRILILDEATASIDTYTEVMIQEALRVLLEGRTAFVIAHRLSTIKNADRIYYIDDGIVVEEGTHDELLALGGRYAKLYLGQFEALEAMADRPA